MMEQEKIATKDEHGEAPRDPLFEWYISAATDYVHKVALATIMFSSSGESGLSTFFSMLLNQNFVKTIGGWAVVVPTS